jgi:crotonobetainyl-CoA:carnitine CoA-transferase CaiB-like acyl-CoA transferase
VTAVSDPSTDERSAQLPLAGIRVFDLTMVWAGPFATKQLADAGAEVIKVEGPGRVDLVRNIAPAAPGSTRPWDDSRYFNEYNRNKLGMAIDLQRPEGQELARRIAAQSDVVIENFRPGVLERLGLGYDVLCELNPRVILVSVPGYSSVAPERGLPAYGPNVEQMSGLAHLNGYPGGPPQKTGISYGDPMAGLAGATAVLLALVHRERTGRGQRIEVGQRNALTSLIGDALIADQLGVEVPRAGNRSDRFAPQGVYRCAVDPSDEAGPPDRWVAVSVRTDAEFAALADELGRPELAADPRFAAVPDRLNHQDDLDAVISGWTAALSPFEVADRLQERGIAASAVLSPVDLPGDPHLLERGFLTTVDHPALGVMNVSTPTLRFDDLHRELVRAPLFGEHNRAVLTGVLGDSDETVDSLEADGILASEPRR